MNPDENMLREIYRLTQDNNRMLHAMRRSAFINSIFRFIFWAIILIGPIWFYMNYLYPVTQTLLQQAQKAQSVGTSVQSQGQDFLNTVKKFIPAGASTTTH